MRKLIVYTLLLALFACLAFATSVSTERRRGLRHRGIRRLSSPAIRRLGGVRRLWIRRSGRRYIVWSQVCSCRRIYRSVRVNSRFGRRLRVFGRAARIQVTRRGGLRVRRLVGKRWVTQRRPNVRVLRVIRRFRPRRNKRLVKVLVRTLRRPRVGAILRSRVTIVRRRNRVAVTFVRGIVRRITTFRYGHPQTRWLERRFGRIHRGITIRCRGRGRFFRCVRIIRRRVGGRVVVRRVNRVVRVTRRVRFGFKRINRVARWRTVVRTGYLWRRHRRRWVCYIRIRRGRRFVFNKFRVVRRLPAPIARIAGNARTIRVRFGSRGARITTRVRGVRVRRVIRYVSPAFRSVIRVTTRIPRRLAVVIRKRVIRKVRKQRVNRRRLVRQIIRKTRITIIRTIRWITLSWTRVVRGFRRAFVCRYRWGGRRARRVVRLWGRIPPRGRVTVRRTGRVWRITRRIGTRRVVVRRPFVRTQVRILRKVISRKVVATPARWRVVPGRRSLKWFRPGRRGRWIFVRKTRTILPARIRNVCRGPNVRSIRIRLRNGRFGVRCVGRNGVKGNVVSLPIVPRFVSVIRKVVRRRVPVRILRVLRPRGRGRRVVRIRGRRVIRRRIIRRRRTPARILRTRRIVFRRVGLYIIGSWKRRGRRCVIRFAFNSRTGRRVQRTFGFIGPRKKIVTFIGRRVIVRTKGSKVVRTIRASRVVRRTLIRVRRVPARVIERRVRFVVVRRFVVLFRRSHRRRRWVIFRRILRTRVNFARGLRRGVLVVRRGKVKVSGVTRTGVFRRVVVRARTGSRILRRISRPRVAGRRRRRTIVIRRVGRVILYSGYTRRGRPFLYTFNRRSRSPVARYVFRFFRLRTVTKVVIKTPRRGRRVVVSRFIGHRRIATRFVPRKRVTGLVRLVVQRARPLTTVRRIRFRRIGRCVVYSRFHKGRWAVFRRQCTGRGVFITRRAVGFVRGLIYITGPRVVIRGRTRTGRISVIRKRITPRVIVRIRAIVPKPKRIQIRRLGFVRRVRRFGRRGIRRHRRRGHGLPTSCFRVWRLGNRIFISKRVRGQCRPVIRSYLSGSRRFSRLLRLAGGRLGRRRRTICRVRGRFIIVGRRGLRGGCPCKSRRRRL